MSSTRLRYDSLNVSARLVAVSVLPSPAPRSQSSPPSVRSPPGRRAASRPAARSCSVTPAGYSRSTDDLLEQRLGDSLEQRARDSSALEGQVARHAAPPQERSHGSARRGSASPVGRTARSGISTRKRFARQRLVDRGSARCAREIGSSTASCPAHRPARALGPAATPRQLDSFVILIHARSQASAKISPPLAARTRPPSLAVVIGACCAPGPACGGCPAVDGSADRGPVAPARRGDRRAARRRSWRYLRARCRSKSLTHLEHDLRVTGRCPVANAVTKALSAITLIVRGMPCDSLVNQRDRLSGEHVCAPCPACAPIRPAT